MQIQIVEPVQFFKETGIPALLTWPRNIPSSSYPIESVGFERPKNVTQSVTKHPKKAGMIPASKVFHTIDSKNSLWYTTIQQNMHMPDMA